MRPTRIQRRQSRFPHTQSLPRQHVGRKAAQSIRARGRGQSNIRLPFVPPEDWHEPRGRSDRFKTIVQTPGAGYRHVLTPQDVRQRLSTLPERFLAGLEVVQFSRMTRKKQSFPCYGMQWGPAIYLYPIEENLVEFYDQPPKPNQVNEARMYGGVWEQEAPGSWKLTWTEDAIRDFYLNNILIHELAHLLDDRNSRAIERERFAEAFAVEWGYLPTREGGGARPVVARHG